jgi:hypothetical protein
MKDTGKQRGESRMKDDRKAEKRKQRRESRMKDDRKAGKISQNEG